MYFRFRIRTANHTGSLRLSHAGGRDLEWRGYGRFLQEGVNMDLCQAMESRTMVEFRYDGLQRLVVPAAYGRHATTGELVLRGYQVGGQSASRPLPRWSLFRVDEMVALRLAGEHFPDDPPGYRRGDRNISPIYCQL